MSKSKLFTCLTTAAITLSVFGFTAACHKAADTSEDTGYASDQAVSEKSFADAQTISDQAAVSPSGSFAYKTTGSACAVVTHTVNPTGDSVITVDFPSSTCICHDGSYRSGEIIITYHGAYAATGSVHTITFNNFFQNGNQITGSKTVTNMGTNAAGQIYFNVSINGSVILANGNGTLSAVWTRTRTWIQQGAPNIYQVYGTGTLTRANGTTVAVNIPAATPLEIASDCRWIESGTVIYTLPSGLTRTLNYGDVPTCDATATLTLPNGKTYTVTQR